MKKRRAGIMLMRNWTLSATLLVASLALAAVTMVGPGAHGHTRKTFAAGAPGDPKKPAREVRVTMAEDGKRMLFAPANIVVQEGDQVRFVLYNDGIWDHEFMLDSFAGNAKHKIAMQKNPEMVHDDPNGRTVSPAGTAEIVWRFTKRGKFEYACLLPGHYEAGMNGVVEVVAKGKAPTTRR